MKNLYDYYVLLMDNPGFGLFIVLSCGCLHKSVTVVDTISTTVIFYLLPFWGCFWKETGDISNISSHKQIVCPDLMQPQAEKTRLGKIAIVIRI